MGIYPARPPMPVNHALHILLCVITAGMWLPVYIIVVLNNGHKMRRFRDGQIIRTAQHRGD